MPVSRLKHFLDDHKIKYVTIMHSPAYTAQETAQSAHIRGGELAKTVVVKLDGRLAMAVLPASQKVNLNLLKAAAGASEAELACEAEFKDKFPECELGAMPPFGNLYGMEVFAAGTLAGDEEIAFNAGSHTELLKMAYQDFADLVQPRIVKLSPAD
ncbi:MAG: YbaK/EbsC family protein [Betaproteobacteria bacterium]|nr:YbaK/EbsC family protein [Betaproteobacteria bacterium]